jgi:hypothetical protein
MKMVAVRFAIRPESSSRSSGILSRVRAFVLRASYLYSYFYFFFYSYPRSFAVRPGEVSA